MNNKFISNKQIKTHELFIRPNSSMYVIGLLLTVFLMSWQSTAVASLTIEIHHGSDSALPIAIIPIKLIEGTVQPKTNITDVISANLFRTGKFKAIPKRQLPAHPSSLSEINFNQWRHLDVDNLLFGTIEINEQGTYNIELRFIDLLRNKQVIAKRWDNVAEGSLREVAHKMSDDIYKELTGIRGIFNTKIAYVTVKRQKNKTLYTLEVADADGFNSQAILRSTMPIMSPSWSPDGTKLAYVTFENGRSEIVIQKLDGTEREIIASFRGINGAPAWSKDGKYMVMTLSKDGSADIYLMNLATRHLRRLTRNFAIETEAVWAPNGRSLFFSSDRRGQPQIFQVFLDTGELRRISFEGRYNSNSAASPDGRYIAMVTVTDNFNIGILDLYTKNFNIITDSFLSESPTFSPNGEMILYSMKKNGKARLAVVSIENSMTQILSTQAGEVRSPAWGPFID